MAHRKRITAPKSWPVPRKEYKWVVKPSPGPHSQETSIPLAVVLRDILKVAHNMREVKKILNEGQIYVDGKVRKNYKFPVGLFDVISIPSIDAHYRVVYDKKGVLRLVETEKPDVKLCKIINKTVVKGGRIQLNLHDGANILGDNSFSTKESILISLPEKNILEKVEYKEGNLALVTGGTHIGELARIKEIRIVRGPQPNRVLLSKDGEDFETIEDYVFVVGEDEPLIEVVAE
ncbi:MAG: small subunit ribosomal protein S4e [Archaeoglobi archaeon]|nr:small subunit ribosomal protein S4e [Archaeoglobi archaeon]